MANPIYFRADRSSASFWGRVSRCPSLTCCSPRTQRRNRLAVRPRRPALSPEDDQFLNDVEKASFLFFWEQGNPKTGMVKDRCNVHNQQSGSRIQHCRHRFRPNRSLHWRPARLHIHKLPRWSACSPRCAFCGRNCPTTADFSTTSPTRKPASACSTPKCLRSIRRFCSAEFLPAASTSVIPESRNWRI